MVQKSKKAPIKENELYILPTPNDEMRLFVNKFKVDMMEHVISSIKFAIENKLSLVEVFQFKNSPFVVTISEKEFDINLEHIQQFFTEHEIYELVPKVEETRQLLQRKNNEKQNPETNGDNSDP